jgi:hypothetical protein
MYQHSTSAPRDTAPEMLRVFDRLGRFVARVTLAELERTVTERRLGDGWTLARDSDLWQPIRVALARARHVTPRPSGIYAKDEREHTRKAS